MQHEASQIQRQGGVEERLQLLGQPFEREKLQISAEEERRREEERRKQADKDRSSDMFGQIIGTIPSLFKF
jgi:hypothetical protein